MFVMPRYDRHQLLLPNTFFIHVDLASEYLLDSHKYVLTLPYNMSFLQITRFIVQMDCKIDLIQNGNFPFHGRKINKLLLKKIRQFVSNSSKVIHCID